jgi:hypothetical protein
VVPHLVHTLRRSMLWQKQSNLSEHAREREVKNVTAERISRWEIRAKRGVSAFQSKIIKL